MDLKSMTGFGRCERITERCRLNVELKSVNSRFLDLSIKMPKKFNALEAAIRNTVKQYIARGKVDLYISYDDYAEASTSLRYNKAIAEEYMKYLQQMAEDFSIVNDTKVSMLSRMPEVLVLDETSEDDEELWALLEPVLVQALQEFVLTRISEGENLKKDLLGKLEEMQKLTEKIEQRAPEILTAYRNKLMAKVNEILDSSSIDESRIVAEVTIFADKICTDEEIVRLKSHISSMQSKLNGGGSVGRELDFIAQEMNREANTTLSKANDIIVSEDAIALKTLIEKIREQVQNLE